MHRVAVALKALFLSIAAAAALSAPSFAQQPTPRLAVHGTNSASSNSWTAGAQAGYNWQEGSAVFGVEADFSGADLRTSMSGGIRCVAGNCPFIMPGASANTLSSVDWYGTFRGRLGWASGPMLLYGTGGLAYGNVDLNSNFLLPNLSLSSRLGTSSIKTGWVLGGGIEYMLRPNMMLNIGYQHIDLGTIRLAAAPSNISCCGDFVTQNASTHARFQVVALGLNWKLTPTDAAPKRPSKPWEYGYFGGHGGGAWGNNASAEYSLFLFLSCFTAPTQILMADGTTRAIAEVKIGDLVLGEHGEVNRVVDIETPVLGPRKLYAFNDGPAFVTAEHPFMTRAGWKSINPEATKAENGNLSVGALKVGDDMVWLETVTTRVKPQTVAFGRMVQASYVQASSIEVLVETKFSALNSTTPHDGHPSMIVYNLRLDGNHTYFANNYLVHNK